MRFLFVSLAILGGLSPVPCAAEPARTKHVTAELVLENSSVPPGSDAASLGLRLEMEPHWHTYWRFPGDSGLPTEVEWKLPPGWSVGPALWPLPQRIFLPPLVNYGFEGEALIGFPLKIPANEPEGEKLIQATASWLVCKEECIPEKVELSLKVRVKRGSAKAGPLVRQFASLRQVQPAALPASASIEIIYKEKLLGIALAGLPELAADTKPDFLPLVPQLVKGDAPPQVEKQAGGTVLWLENADPLDASLKELQGVLVLGGGSKVFALAAALPVSPVPAVAATTALPTEKSEIWIPVLFAFLGGLLLNLMPCVFPVLGIKVMSLVRQSGKNSRQTRMNGNAYAIGVLACFWLLAGVLLVLRSAGESIGWGFQLQQPVFVTMLILLFSFVTADLAGLVRWSGRWMGAGAGLANKEGLSGSFFTGMLAVLVATPCTAPFMGTAIGAVIAEPAGIVFIVFSSLALGLSLPFLLLCYQPGFLSILPKPGAWMERLKELFAFPMAATVLWLLWVLNLQIGADGTLKVELGLLVFMTSLWVFQRFSSGAVRSLAVVLLVSGVLISIWGAATKPADAAMSGESWKPYSEAALSEAITAGKPVFVDFTAAWCLTCQINKKLVLDRGSLQSYLKEKGVVLLLADWTNRDPEITRALEREGRLGVPLYLAYRGGEKKAEVLPQILTENRVREAFP